MTNKMCDCNQGRLPCTCKEQAVTDVISEDVAARAKALIPAKLHLDKSVIGAINFHCGDSEDGESQFGSYADGLLWVGAIRDDDGKEVYGLHIATAEYPEEGSTTLVEFEPAVDENAELRQQLADVSAERDILRGQRNKALEKIVELSMDESSIYLQAKLNASEARNAEAIRLATLVQETLRSEFWDKWGGLNEARELLERIIKRSAPVCDGKPDGCERNEGYGCDCTAAQSAPATDEQGSGS